MSVFVPPDRVGSFTQAVRAPLDFVKFSISWGSTVVPPESVKTISFPLAWAFAARSESEERLTRTGKLVWVPEIIVPLTVSFFRPVQLHGLMTRGEPPPPPHGDVSSFPGDEKRSGRFWLVYSVLIQSAERAPVDTRISSSWPRNMDPSPEAMVGTVMAFPQPSPEWGMTDTRFPSM